MDSSLKPILSHRVVSLHVDADGTLVYTASLHPAHICKIYRLKSANKMPGDKSFDRLAPLAIDRGVAMGEWKVLILLYATDFRDT